MDIDALMGLLLLPYMFLVTIVDLSDLRFCLLPIRLNHLSLRLIDMERPSIVFCVLEVLGNRCLF